MDNRFTFKQEARKMDNSKPFGPNGLTLEEIRKIWNRPGLAQVMLQNGQISMENYIRCVFGEDTEHKEESTKEEKSGDLNEIKFATLRLLRRRS